MSRYLGLAASAGAMLGGLVAVGLAELLQSGEVGSFFLGCACGLVGFVAAWELWPK